MSSKVATALKRCYNMCKFHYLKCLRERMCRQPLMEHKRRCKETEDTCKTGCLEAARWSALYENK